MLYLIRHTLVFTVGLLTQYPVLFHKASHEEREVLVWLANMILVENISYHDNNTNIFISLFGLVVRVSSS